MPAPNSGYVVWDGQPTTEHEPCLTVDEAVAQARELLERGARTVHVLTVNLPLESASKGG